MNYTKKLGTFILTVLCFPISCICWWICLILAFVGVGFYLFSIWASAVFQDGRSSYFFKSNKNYGTSSYYSYTDKVQKDIYDDNGYKIGSYETNGETHSGWTEDTRNYVARYPLFIIYMLLFPIHKILALVASFLSLFTTRFYVSVEAPKDYNHIKYNRTLHCFFNVVAERSVNKQKEIIERQQEKQRKKNNILNAKKEKQLANENKKKEQLKTADKYLGILIKVLGIIGVIIALYFILKQIA